MYKFKETKNHSVLDYIDYNQFNLNISFVYIIFKYLKNKIGDILKIFKTFSVKCDICFNPEIITCR